MGKRYFFHLIVAVTFLLLNFDAVNASKPKEVIWKLDQSHLRRIVIVDGVQVKRTSWRKDRISWFPFIAWEEKRIGSPEAHIVWVDTPSKIHRTRLSNGRVVGMKTFKKGSPIPIDLRPSGRKTLWVILDKTLVRKVLIGDDVASEYRYRKAKVPLHPFVVAKESTFGGISTKTISFESDDRNVLIAIKDNNLDSFSTKWKKPGDTYDLPSLDELENQGAATDSTKAIPAIRETITVNPKSSAPKISSGEIPENSTRIPRHKAGNIPRTKKSKPKIQPKPPQKREKFPKKASAPKDLPLNRTESPRQLSSPHWSTRSITGRTIVSLLEQGRYRNGLDYAIRRRKSKPKDHELLFLEGIATAWCGNLKRASKLLAKSSAVNKSYKLPLVEAALIEAINGRPQISLQLLSNINGKRRPPRHSLVNSIALFMMRDIEKSIEQCLQTANEDSSLERLFIAARCSDLLSRQSDSTDFYRDLLLKCPVNYHCLLPEALTEISSINKDLMKPELSKEQPVNLLLVTAAHYGSREYNFGNYKRAAEGFAKACLVSGNCYEMVFNCALALEKAGNRTDAISMYKRLQGKSNFKKIMIEKLNALGTQMIDNTPELSNNSFNDGHTNYSSVSGANKRRETKAFYRRGFFPGENDISPEELARSRKLDDLFNAVKVNMNKTATKKTLNNSSQPSLLLEKGNREGPRAENMLTSIRLSTVSVYENNEKKVEETIVSGHRKSGIELRYGGKGERKGSGNSEVRITPSFFFPDRIKKDLADQTFTVRAQGTALCGTNNSLCINLTVSYPNSSVKFKTSKTIQRTDDNSLPQQVELSLSAEILDAKVPQFTISITGKGERKERQFSILENRIIPMYEPARLPLQKQTMNTKP